MDKENIKICNNCDHCIYIGDGAYMCDVYEENETPEIVLEEHTPTDSFWWCAGSEWEEE